MFGIFWRVTENGVIIESGYTHVDIEAFAFSTRRHSFLAFLQIAEDL